MGVLTSPTNNLVQFLGDLKNAMAGYEVEGPDTEALLTARINATNLATTYVRAASKKFVAFDKGIKELQALVGAVARAGPQAAAAGPGPQAPAGPGR